MRNRGVKGERRDERKNEKKGAAAEQELNT